jgi:hypothetical protein
VSHVRTCVDPLCHDLEDAVPAKAPASPSRGFLRPLPRTRHCSAIVIELGREIFGARRVTSATFARSLQQFGRRALVDLVALMGNYAGTAALLTVFDMQLDPGQPQPLPPL